MNTLYETQNLELRVLGRESARLVLDFYSKNADDFAKYEPLKKRDALNLNYHASMLDYEREYFEKNTLLRLYLFRPFHPFEIVGTVCFRNIMSFPYKCATLGYKMDQRYRRLGYMEEAITRGLQVMDEELHLRRIEATVMPDNEPSYRLLEKIGFQREGLIRDRVNLNGKWEDHYLYSHIFPHNG